MTFLMWVTMAYAGPYGWDGERIPSRLGPVPIPEVWLWQPEGGEGLTCEDGPEGCLEMSMEWATLSGGWWWRIRLTEGVDPWEYRDAYRETGAWVLVEPVRLALPLDWVEGVAPSSWSEPHVEPEALVPGSGPRWWGMRLTRIASTGSNRRPQRLLAKGWRTLSST